MTLRTVLCPVDFTPLSNAGLEAAVRLCRQFGARLVLEHNLDPAPPPWMGVSWMWTESHEAELERKAAHAERRLKEILDELPHDMKREAKLTRGPVVQWLLLVAKQVQADLIVMGSHGWSTPDHSSVTEQIILESPCPVLTIQGESAPKGLFEADRPGAKRRCALVPIEPSEHGMSVAEHAMRVAEDLPLRLVFLTIAAGEPDAMVPEIPASAMVDLDAFEARVREHLPENLAGRVEFVKAAGRPSEEILDCCSRVGPSLVVMGCHSHRGLKKIFSRPTSKEILHRSRCPVWFVSPAAVKAGVQPVGV